MSGDNDNIEVICTQWVKIHSLRVLSLAAVKLTIQTINSSGPSITINCCYENKNNKYCLIDNDFE